MLLVLFLLLPLRRFTGTPDSVAMLSTLTLVEEAIFCRLLPRAPFHFKLHRLGSSE
jgi:hypothetical protein